MEIRFRVMAVLVSLSLGLDACVQEMPAEVKAAPEGIGCDVMLAKTPGETNDANGRLLRLMAPHEHARRNASRVNFAPGTPFLARCDAGPATNPRSLEGRRSLIFGNSRLRYSHEARYKDDAPIGSDVFVE